MRKCNRELFWRRLPQATTLTRFAGKYPFRVRIFRSASREHPESETLYTGKPTYSAFRRVMRLMRAGHYECQIRLATPTGLIKSGVANEGGMVTWGTDLRSARSLVYDWTYGDYQPFLVKYVPYRYNRRAALVEASQINTRRFIQEVRRGMNNQFIGGNR